MAPAVSGPCAPPAGRGCVAQTLGRRPSTRRIPARALGAGGTPSDGGTRVKCPRGNGPKRRVCANAGWCRGKHPAPPQLRPRRSARARGAVADGRGGQVCGTCDKRSAPGRPLESDQVRRTRRRQATDLAPKARSHTEGWREQQTTGLQQLCCMGGPGLTCGLAGNHLCVYIKHATHPPTQPSRGLGGAEGPRTLI